MSSAEQNTSTRKRPRADDGADAGPTPTPSTVKSSMYFDDGNIILRTLSDDKGVYTHFRVHKSILALHSNVFRGMLGEADTVHFAGASEQVDGVPLMHLHDKAEDVEDFLRALYEPDFLHRHNNLKKYELRMSNYPQMYRGAMKLAKKYEAETLCDIFASSLRQAWPSDWKAYTETQDGGDSFAHLPSADWSIHMANELDISEVLPYAFYTLCACLAPGGDVITPDGQLKGKPELDNEMILSILNLNEVTRLFLGGRRLASYVYEHVTARELPSMMELLDCPNNTDQQCYQHMTFAWEKLMRAMETVHDATNPFSIVLSATDDLAACQPCLDKFRGELDKVGKDVWDKLPAFFNLSMPVD